jgi:lysophospholipase L1-like esterase
MATNPLTVPTQGTDPDWLDKFNAQKVLVQRGCKMFFLGDSITSHWKDVGAEVWSTHYSNRNALCLGIGGDRIENVLWRIDNYGFVGEPKLAVLMIGTNNVRAGNDPKMVAEGMTNLVNRLQTLLPTTNILLLGLLPREEMPYSPYRLRAAEATGRFSELMSKHNVYFRDIGKYFLDDSDLFLPNVTPDFLHLAAGGYTIWADKIEPLVAKLLA